MTDKKWWKNIPENGVLCILSKLDKNNNQDVIMAVTQQMIEGANSEPSEDDLKKIRPLTADEWWQFAPWQDMKDAPMCEKILLVPVSGKPITGCIFCNADRRSYTKWLPLPEQSQ